jgi:formylglycine-generating enzyme required for sulfatase activity/tRNA A-37 threonylcarbamoyl transferase component Bud32
MNCRHCQHSITGNPRWCPNCGKFVPESLIGQVLGDKYELLGVLGMGGMGAVYRARRKRIRDEVVVKILLPSLSQESARFHREAEAAARVKHSNVVIIHDSDEARGELPAFIAMEMVKGVPLRHLLQSEGRLEPARAVMLMRCICAGVGAAHRLGVVHRDLKPENVIIVPPEEDGETETVKVLDFGIAKLLDKEATLLTLDGTVLGTTYYMSPEQWRGEEVDARADIYSLGVMLYEMLTGTFPFIGRTPAELMMKHLFEPPPSLTLDRGARPELEAVIKGALAKERDARQPNATELSRALQAAMTVTLPSLLTFEFDTVTLDTKGVVIDRRRAQARYYAEDLGDGATLEMVKIPAGTFTMGSPESEAERFDDEGLQRQVRVPEFYMGKYEVTQAQWRAVASLPKVKIDLKPDPSGFKGDNLPVELVSWDEAVEFCARLSKATGREYRLPSEVEWEYACRAGTATPFAFGETITPGIANYDGNYPYGGAAKGTYRARTTAVGSLGVANGFGLYDMYGNVWEWCEDIWHENYNGAPTDGSAWLSGGDSSDRVLRGGSWGSVASLLRSANRGWAAPGNRNDGHGLRLVAVARSS